MSQQGTEKSIFRVIFRIGFDIITTMILQITISRFNLFLLNVVKRTLQSQGKRKLLNIAVEIKAEHIFMLCIRFNIITKNDSAAFKFVYAYFSMCFQVGACFFLTGCTCCT